MAYEYQTLGIEITDHVMRATIHQPPVNVMTVAMYQDLVALTTEVEQDSEVKVVIFQSADPDFFIAHFDVEVLLGLDTSPEKRRKISPFQKMCERLQTMPKVTIAKIAGRAGGGGSELAASCDMRFGLAGKTIINQMEVALGILPGGTGTQRLPRLVGRGRAMEICLGSDDIDAQTAADWGYLNRVFDTQVALDQFVDHLATRIATFPSEAIALCKASINNAELPLAEGLAEESNLFQQALSTQSAQSTMREAMVMGLQTRAAESKMGAFALEVAEAVQNTTKTAG